MKSLYLAQTALPERADLVIATCGYEKRSAQLLEEVNASSGVAYGYPQRQVLSYAKNREKFESRGFDVDVISDSHVTENLKGRLHNVIDRCGPNVRVVLDISSMSRRRLAVVFAELINTLPEGSTIHLIYYLGKYQAPTSAAVDFAEIGPISSRFSGWSLDPDLPLATVVGLGFERDKALGVTDLLEAALVDSWVFIPLGDDQRFRQQLEDANGQLLPYVPDNHKVEYQVRSPLHLCATLESLVGGLRDRFRLVIVPMGPKIFTAASLAVAAKHGFTIPIWSVSSGQEEQPVDVEAEPGAISLTVNIADMPHLNPLEAAFA